MPQLQQPSTHAAPHSPARIILPTSAILTYAMALFAQPLAPPPPLFPTRSWHSSLTLAHAATPLPAFTTTPQRLPTTLPEQSSSPQFTPRPPPSRREPETNAIDFSEKVLPPTPQRQVNQPYHSHPFIMDDTDIFPKESQRIIDRFSTKIGGRDTSRRFQGVVNPETSTSLDMTNDLVLFDHKFRSGFSALPSWALPLDQPESRNQPAMPQRNKRTPIRVTVLL